MVLQIRLRTNPRLSLRFLRPKLLLNTLRNGHLQLQLRTLLINRHHFLRFIHRTVPQTNLPRSQLALTQKDQVRLLPGIHPHFPLADHHLLLLIVPPSGRRNCLPRIHLRPYLKNHPLALRKIHPILLRELPQAFRQQTLHTLPLLCHHNSLPLNRLTSQHQNHPFHPPVIHPRRRRQSLRIFCPVCRPKNHPLCHRMSLQTFPPIRHPTSLRYIRPGLPPVNRLGCLRMFRRILRLINQRQLRRVHHQIVLLFILLVYPRGPLLDNHLVRHRRSLPSIPLKHHLRYHPDRLRLTRRKGRAAPPLTNLQFFRPASHPLHHRRSLQHNLPRCHPASLRLSRRGFPPVNRLCSLRTFRRIILPKNRRQRLQLVRRVHRRIVLLFILLVYPRSLLLENHLAYRRRSLPSIHLKHRRRFHPDRLRLTRRKVQVVPPLMNLQVLRPASHPLHHRRSLQHNLPRCHPTSLRLSRRRLPPVNRLCSLRTFRRIILPKNRRQRLQLVRRVHRRIVLLFILLVYPLENHLAHRRGSLPSIHLKHRRRFHPDRLRLTRRKVQVVPPLTNLHLLRPACQPLHHPTRLRHSRRGIPPVNRLCSLRTFRRIIRPKNQRQRLRLVRRVHRRIVLLLILLVCPRSLLLENHLAYRRRSLPSIHLKHRRRYHLRYHPVVPLANHHHLLPASHL